MTIRERAYRNAHRKLWGWLADNPDKEKKDWPGWSFNGGTYPFAYLGCFACEYMRGMSNAQCWVCPCFTGKRSCGGCFDRWEHAKRLSTRRKYALLVRDAWPISR
jgi:hypothetical protein